MMNPIEFARNLFALRMERSLSVEELAEALDVTPELICEWECARTSPSLDQMNRLARVYGIPLDEIIRNPRSHPEITPAPPVAAEPEPPETEAYDPPEPEPKPTPKPKRKIQLWEILILLLILSVMGAALYFLLCPERFPLPPSSVTAVREWISHIVF